MEAKYREIANELRAKICSGEFEKLGVLPTGKDLAREYNTSLLTITKAVDVLVREGYLVRKRGAGTFIKKNASKSEYFQYKHLLGTSERNINSEVKTHVLKFKVTHATEELARILSIAPEDLIYEIHRVREIDGRRSIIEYTYMPVVVIPNLKNRHIEGSIYSYIKDELKINISSSHIFIKSALPNEVELANLDFVNGEFLIEISQVVHSNDGTIIEHSIARHVHDTFNFENDYSI